MTTRLFKERSIWKNGSDTIPRPVNNSAYPQYNQSYDSRSEAGASSRYLISCSLVCAYRNPCTQSWDLVLLSTIAIGFLEV
jgi:hypothetical protein